MIDIQNVQVLAAVNTEASNRVAQVDISVASGPLTSRSSASVRLQLAFFCISLP